MKRLRLYNICIFKLVFIFRYKVTKENTYFSFKILLNEKNCLYLDVQSNKLFFLLIDIFHVENKNFGHTCRNCFPPLIREYSYVLIINIFYIEYKSMRAKQ